MHWNMIPITPFPCPTPCEDTVTEMIRSSQDLFDEPWWLAFHCLFFFSAFSWIQDFRVSFLIQRCSINHRCPATMQSFLPHMGMSFLSSKTDPMKMMLSSIFRGTNRVILSYFLELSFVCTVHGPGKFPCLEYMEDEQTIEWTVQRKSHSPHWVLPSALVFLPPKLFLSSALVMQEPRRQHQTSLLSVERERISLSSFPKLPPWHLWYVTRLIRLQSPCLFKTSPSALHSQTVLLI